ncbi:MAG TPA: hypothetical protein VN648_29965, partial [Candidatus Methylomirabilis sp.]|nr:hypothetical protein [Candidatus Methylomirabilis sp.]
MRIITKIRGAMWWRIVLVTTLVSVGPGVMGLAWAEEGMDLVVNVRSGLAEPPGGAAVPDSAPAAMPREGVAPDRETAEETQGGPQEGWNPVEASSMLSESPSDPVVSD